MTGKHNGTAPRDLSAIGGDPSRQRGDWKHVGGSPSDDWNNRIAVETVTRCESDERAREQQDRAAIDGLIGIAPQDELEGMMAAQIIAAHGGAMACYRCAAEASEGPARRDDLAVADRLARTFALLAATLHRHRRKARRTITVEYVHVEPDADARAASAKKSENDPMQSPRRIARAASGGAR